jgi:hypothetical protein
MSHFSTFHGIAAIALECAFGFLAGGANEKRVVDAPP